MASFNTNAGFMTQINSVILVSSWAGARGWKFTVWRNYIRDTSTENAFRRFSPSPLPGGAHQSEAWREEIEVTRPGRDAAFGAESASVMA
jgi:hypothetical protein